jgi:iron(III) transport system substrate-binding protein
MKRRHFLTTVSTGLAGAVALAACGQQATTGATSAAAPTTAASGGGTSATQAASTLLTGAQKDGKVLIYSTTDSASAKPLLDDFKAAFPGVNVDYSDQNSTDMYNKFTAESAAGAETADFMWSSAMDLQFKLASDGMAMTYQSPEAAKLPDGSVWQNQAYGTTLEPFTVMFNKRAIGDAIPTTHADLTKLFKDKPDLFKGKVTSYDPEKSGTGYLAMTQDVKFFPGFWDMADALGKLAPPLQTSTGTMIEKVASGENVLGFDIIGSYVLAKTKQDPNVGLTFLKDYTVGFSRIAFINKNAKRPNAAKLFLDYILSKRGQDVMAKQALVYALRPDAEGEATFSALSQAAGGAGNIKSIKVNAELLQALDPTKRLDFIQKWQKSLGRS